MCIRDRVVVVGAAAVIVVSGAAVVALVRVMPACAGKMTDCIAGLLQTAPAAGMD